MKPSHFCLGAPWWDFWVPLAIYTLSQDFAIDYTVQLALGAAVTKWLQVNYSITFYDAAGATKQCGNSINAEANWNIVRRRRSS